MKRTLAPALGAMAALCAFALTAFAQDALPGSERPSDGHGPVGARQLVAEGTSTQRGDWKLYASTDTRGDVCIGVLVNDSVTGLPALSEACGDAVENQVGSISGAKSTFFFGRVSDRASGVVVSKGDQAKKTDTVLKGKDGHKYVATETVGNDAAAEVSLTDERGAKIGRVDPATK